MLTSKLTVKVYSLGFVYSDTLFTEFSGGWGISLCILTLHWYFLAFRGKYILHHVFFVSVTSCYETKSYGHITSQLNKIFRLRCRTLCAMHSEFIFIAVFLCIRDIRIFAYFLVQQSSIRQSTRPINCILLLPTTTCIPFSPSPCP
jgi:hypothetical protein